MLWKRHLFWAALLSSVLLGISAPAQELSPEEIIRRSVEVNQRDWREASGYDYFQRERLGKGTKTYEIIMLDGSRYSRLVAVDDEPLSAEQKEQEQQRFDAAVAQRQQESPEERKSRIAQYQQERERDRNLMGELTKALDFSLAGQDNSGSHPAYVLKGTPRPGYHPPNREAKALTGMQGTLWIDQATFHWVKVAAEVVRPVWITGFFAQLQPGTHFELEQTPVREGIWMPSRFAMEAHAKVLFFFSRNQREDNEYFGYHKSGVMPAATASTK